MRYSRQREALLDVLRATTTHPDAQWLYLALREKYPNISLGTVYRNLRQLASEGEILELPYGNTSHFDGDISLHYHMRCDICGKIIDIPKENVAVSLKITDGTEIMGFSLFLNGICRECKKEN